MRSVRSNSLLVLVALFLAPPAFAQYGSIYDEAPRWHLNGSVGVDLGGNTFTTQTDSQAQSENGSAEYGGDIRLVGSGFWRDPRLLDFNASITQLRSLSSQSEAISEQGTSSRGISFVANLLNGRSFPFTISYVRSSLGSSGFGGSRNDLISDLGFAWKLRALHFPRIDVSYRTSEYDTSTPIQFVSNNSKTRNFLASVQGTADGWNYTGGFNRNDLKANSLGTLTLSAPQQNDSTSLDGHLDRTFWDNKASIATTNFYTSQTSDGIIGSGESKTFGDSTQFSYRFSPKLMAHTGYDYGRITAQTNLSSNNPIGTPVELVQPDFSQHDADGGVEYAPFHGLIFSGGLHYTVLSPQLTISEYVTSLITPTGSVSASHRWRGFDLSGSYSASINRMVTNLGRTPQGLGQNISGNAAWGSLQRVRFSGSFNYGNQNVAQILGAFTHTRRASLQAESAAWDGWRFRARADYYNTETLTTNGDLNNRAETVSFQVERPRFAVNLTQTFNTGFGAIFPISVAPPGQFIYSLPVDLLVNTPLLDHTSDGTSVMVTLFLRQNLDFNATWSRYSDGFDTLNQHTNNFLVHAIYRYGKFSFEGGYQKYDTNYLALPQAIRNQANANRYYVRIARNFTIF